MKKLIYFVLSILFVSCASFNPSPIQYSSAKSNPESIVKDSVYVMLKQYNSKESELIFDDSFDDTYYKPVYISIYNASSEQVTFDPKSVLDYYDYRIVIDDMTKPTAAYLFGWSVPWIINIAVGLPIYYGAIWPVFGIIAAVKSSNINDEVSQFYESVIMKKIILSKDQESGGFIFLNKTMRDYISINVTSGSSIITFDFPNLKLQKDWF